jgi:RNase P subunit RPR2
MNIKQRCAKCKRDLVAGKTKQVMMIGPRGYRRYAVCERCAGKTPLSSNTTTSPQMKVRHLGGVRKGGV